MTSICSLALRQLSRRTTQRAFATQRSAPLPLNQNGPRAASSGAQRAVPMSLDEFDIDFCSPLGYGAVGTVFAGQHRITGQEVAIKTVASVITDMDGNGIQQNINSSELTDSIVHESKAFAQMIGSDLSHPQIVDCMGCFTGTGEEAAMLGLDLPDNAIDEPMHYFVMERLHGANLKDLVDKEESINEKEASKITRAVCEGLECLHQNGIVHRDIKLGNIMLPEIGADAADVKLIDFSHAGVVPEGSTDSASEAKHFTKKLGTTGYVAPEILSQSEPYSASCDIFSVGCTVHAMLSNGRLPTCDEEGVVTSLPESISQQGRDLVDLLLTFSPDDRPTITEALQQPWLQKSE